MHRYGARTPSILTPEGAVLGGMASSIPREALPLNRSLGSLFQYSEAIRGLPEAQGKAGEVCERRILA